MSEQATEQDQAGQQSAEEQTNEVPRPEGLPKDQEWDHVEFDEKTQRRFNRVYAEMKSTKELVQKMGEDNRRLIDKLEEMEAKQAQKSVDDRVTVLRAQEKEALEAGDYDRAGQIRDQITDFRVEAKIPKEKPKPEKTEEEKADEWLNEERANKINAWVNARDDKGNLRHPWADPNHPEHQTSLTAARVIIEKDPDRPLDEILEEIAKVNDKVIPTRKTASVLGSGDTPPPKKKTGLSDDEKKIAAAMYPELALKDAAERYAKSKERLGL